MGFRIEHPDWRWNAEQVEPPLPDQWHDVSWHNDECPSWIWEEVGLLLYIGYEDDEELQYRMMLWDTVTDTQVLVTNFLDIAMSLATQLYELRQKGANHVEA